MLVVITVFYICFLTVVRTLEERNSAIFYILSGQKPEINVLFERMKTDNFVLGEKFPKKTKDFK